MYLSLIPDKIVRTSEKIAGRIRSQFPDSGLSKVADELFKLSQTTMERCNWITRPILGLRFLIGIIIMGIIAAVIFLVWLKIVIDFSSLDITRFIEFLEPLLNILIIFGAALLFLITAETRIKRKKALDALHELRAMAHVIDMHQLTKDPKIILGQKNAAEQGESMTAFQLMRYLDFCCDLLAIIGKIAALYGQHLDDSVVLNSVNDVEMLTTSLSSKIWQKIKFCKD